MSLSSHNYKSLIISKDKNEEDEKDKDKEDNKNKKKEKEKDNKNTIIRGTIKLDKVHYLMKKEDKRLFEDINLQYIEPLEGDEDDSDKDEISYNRYLNNVNRELNTKKEEIVFINDLGLNSNLLNTKEIFDKIRKQNKSKIIKSQSSFNSFNASLIKNKKLNADASLVELEENENVKINNDKIKEALKKKKIRLKKEKKENDVDLSYIGRLMLSKLEVKKFINNEKRIMTYNNLNNINLYLNQKDLLLNIREKRNNLRKIKSGRIFKKIEMIKRGKTKNNSIIFGSKSKKYNENPSENEENEKEDIFGEKKKKNNYIDPYYLLDDEEISDKSEKEKEAENKIPIIEIKAQINKEEEVKKSDEYVHPLIKLEESIKRINMKLKKKKKPPPPPPVEDQKKEEKKKKLLQAKKKKEIKIKYRDTTSVKIESTGNNINNNIRLKSPVINSILNDINGLSKLIIKKVNNKKKKQKQKNSVKYEKHFGYEYWKENIFRRSILHPIATNKRKLSSFRSISSTVAPDDNSLLSNFSSFLNNNNNKNFNNINNPYSDFNDNFSFNINNDDFNPYSINWTRKMLKNAYNKNIKLKKGISGVPEIELMARSRSSFFTLQPKISINMRNIVDSKNNNFYNKNSKMFGRIYNKNEVEFPLIRKS